MATPADTVTEKPRPDEEMEAGIAALLRDAESGRAFACDGNEYTAAGVRRLRAALALVAADADAGDLAAVRGLDAAGLARLGRAVVERAGVRPSRVAATVEALHALSRHAIQRAAPGPRPFARPVAAATTARTPPSAGPVATATTTRTPPSAGPHAADTTTRTPTYTMLALGAHVGAWVERIIVVAFALAAIGLALELA